MINELEKIKKTRLFLINLVEDLSPEQLNEIPEGFNNNIVWNLGHLIATQQGICYIRSGLKVVTEEKYFLPYKPGTKPEKFIDIDEVNEVKKLLISTLDRFEADYNQHIFSVYEPVTLRYGVTLSSIDDAIGFLSFHEGLHHGYIMALKRAIKRGS